MDINELCRDLLDLWRIKAMGQSSAADINKKPADIPLYVLIEGKHHKITDVMVLDGKITLIKESNDI